MKKLTSAEKYSEGKTYAYSDGGDIWVLREIEGEDNCYSVWGFLKLLEVEMSRLYMEYGARTEVKSSITKALESGKEVYEFDSLNEFLSWALYMVVYEKE